MIGAYGSGKTSLAAALGDAIDSTVLPMAKMWPAGAHNFQSVHEWTPPYLIQASTLRFADRLRAEPSHQHGFISDGTVFHDWAYTETRLRWGSYPSDENFVDPSTLTGNAESLLDINSAHLEAVKVHAEGSYEILFHLPIEYPLRDDNRPIDEEFRIKSDKLLLDAVSKTRIPVHVLHGSIAARIDQARRLLPSKLNSQAR